MLTLSPPVKLARFYPSDTPAGRVETYLLERKIADIGKPAPIRYWSKKWESEEIIPPGIDMDKDSRAMRTLFVKKLGSDEQLATWHKMELDHGYWLEFFQIKKYLEKIGGFKAEIKTKNWDAAVEQVTKFNDERRPSTWEFSGMRVPPYFIYDLSFNGMPYHHAWDKNVRIATLNLRLGSAGQLSEQFADSPAGLQG